MALSPVRQKSYCFILFAGLVVLSLLAACGSTPSSTSSPTSTSPSNPTHVPNGIGATPSAAESALIKEMTFVGSSTAKLVSGTTFEVDGKIKNGDDKQHDIYVKVMLLDASGKQIATATQNVDNVAGGDTASFAIQGTTPQSIWSNVRVSVIKVTENVGGSGSD